jgi:hypothetical protein
MDNYLVLTYTKEKRNERDSNVTAFYRGLGISSGLSVAQAGRFNVNAGILSVDSKDGE